MSQSRDRARQVLPSPSGATTRGRVWRDRLASGVVRAGGLAVVASLLGILCFLAAEVLPLFGGADVREEASRLPLEGPEPHALISDEYRTHVAALDAAGTIRVARTRDGAIVARRALVSDGEVIGIGREPDQPVFTAATADGRIALARVDWRLSFRDGQRTIAPALGEPTLIDVAPAGARITAHAARLRDERTTAVAALDDGSLAVVRIEIEENDFTGEREETVERLRLPAPPGLGRLVLDPDQTRVFGGTSDGRLLSWALSPTDARAPETAQAGAAPITALSLLNGGRALVAGQEDGSLSVWFRMRYGRARVELERIREFEAQATPIRAIAPSGRDRSFLVSADGGRLGLYHSTSNRRLWTGTLDGAIGALGYAPRGNGAFVALDGQLANLDVENPHPEAGLSSFFRRIWYEGYGDPEYVWQSTGGTDEFEPKLSLTPLLAGTLKGTAYALLFAIPLGILGAIFNSQFLDPRLQRVVKPIVELMASLPTVVLGFLAGLWLAPRLEPLIPALLLMLLGFPLFAVLAGGLWNLLPRAVTGRLPAGTELVAFALLLVAGGALCVALNEPFEALAFGGDFSTWLTGRTGLAYDQRNAIVAGIAMGFAVIPIIFAISEDSLTNVPRSLSAASLALGATRWQTLARVILPAASPGLFAAVMIGFGRAVGETMIVLMATGNTPLLDWNAFNGFRTLSANIAVEIPEAPHGGTLYRTLFLSGLLLFALTFLVNTAAELVRERLRRRYAGP